MGLTYPHPDRLLKLLFGCSRGLLFASPVMAAAPFGLWWLMEGETFFGGSAGRRRDRGLLLPIQRFLLLVEGRANVWSAICGGVHSVVVPGTRCGLVESDAGVAAVLIGLAVCSVALTLMVVSTTSQLAMQDSCPLVHSVWPAFWSGRMASNPISMLTVTEAGSSGNYGAFNLGQLMGLRGLASLVPLLAVWAVAAVAWWRMEGSAWTRDRSIEFATLESPKCLRCIFGAEEALWLGFTSSLTPV